MLIIAHQLSLFHTIYTLSHCEALHYKILCVITVIHQNFIEVYEPSDEENNDPNTSQQNASRSSTPTKKLVLPKEFFEYVGDSVGKNSSQYNYKCLFPGCAKKKDQSDKLLVVANTSRHNAKRHYLNHYPKDELGHEKLWDDAIKKLTADD